MAISIVNFDEFFGKCREYKINTVLQTRAFLQVATSNATGFNLKTYNVEPEVSKSVYNALRVLMGYTEEFEKEDPDRYRTDDEILIEQIGNNYFLTSYGLKAWHHLKDDIVSY